MPRLVIMHAVEDIDRWLQGKTERASVIGTVGANITDYVALDGSSSVAITADIHDLDGAKALMSSPSAEDMALMQKHGVVPPITAYIES
jgi:hypothetical protein